MRVSAGAGRKESGGELGKEIEGEVTASLRVRVGDTQCVVTTRSMRSMRALGVRHKVTDGFMHVYADGVADA